MDSHFHEISLGLYQLGSDDDASFLVHTYAGRRGGTERVEFVAAAMASLGGMSVEAQEASRVRFPCGSEHQFACRRNFLEAAKLPTGSELGARPLEIYDKKTDQTIDVQSRGEGEYLVRAGGDEDKQRRRAAVAALGLSRLGEMELVADTSDQIRFGCGTPHDALIGLLLGRALNVRTAMREVEAQAARGVLAAPSAQSD